MNLWTDRVRNGLLNSVLLVLGLGVMLLMYALVTRTTTPRSNPNRVARATELVGPVIQVEVRNGAGVDHLAARTTRFLRDRGFDVVEVGNYGSFAQEHSVVIDRVGDLESARKVARALSIPEDRVEQDIRTDYYLDASVILGKDYRTLRPFQGQVDVQPAQ
ncbi:hypothetical protein CRI94_11340 [Longibacter salinarum]|uniref:LytR/CpsA/Psr regulator C-terminal domain-containing protein n=1 Tax=Longibacter salinarum TaxID=1850348 RepID=A0A2A8CXC9_9BACT|nr:LytR C-terminal domain-containing protein [Longibacter salinarum]PEN13227.1 hypothetical protein CRI94_11340 [Longibacter salinarum]